MPKDDTPTWSLGSATATPRARLGFERTWNVIAALKKMGKGDD